MVDVTSRPEAIGSAPDATGSRRDRRWEVVVLGATVLAGALVAFRIGRHGFWFDEGSTIGTVDRAFGDALWRIANWELNQSTYHLLVLAWKEVVTGEAALRSLSGVFAVAAVPATWVVGRRLVGARGGAVAALLLALHPFAIQWGQQLRGYSLLLLLTVLSTLLFVRAVDSPSWGRSVAYGLVIALAVYTQFFAVLVLISQVASLPIRGAIPRRLVVGGGATAGVLLLPALEFFLNRRGDPLAWVVAPGREQVLGTAEALAGGAGAQLLGYGVVVAAGAVALLRRAVDRTDPDAAWRAALPVLLLVVPLVATVAVSLTIKPLVEARFLMVVLPGLVLVAGAAIDRMPAPLAGAALAGLVLVSGLGLRDWYERPPFEQWREGVQVLAAEARPGDLVLTTPSRAAHVARYYVDSAGVPVSVGTPEDLSRAGPPTVFELVRHDDGRVDPRGARPEVSAWLGAHYRLVDEHVLVGVLLREHERR